MSKFLAFANIGMTAAAKATKSRREVDEVFAELNRDLEALGDVRLVVREFHELPGISAAIQTFMNPKQYMALAVESTSNESFRPMQIARWKQPLEGYPCWVITEGEEVACEDRRSLEAELGRLLSSVKVGQALTAAIAAGRSNGEADPPGALPA